MKIYKTKFNEDTIEKSLYGETKISSLENLVLHKESIDWSRSDDVAYFVETHKNDVADKQFGGLYFGVSHLNPGLIGDEFIFTRGHFHEEMDTGEYYWVLKGNGLILLKDLDGEETITELSEGDIIYIPGNIAHRLVNTGKDIFSVGAVWQSISGHKYSDNKNLFKTHILKSTTDDYDVVEG